MPKGDGGKREEEGRVTTSSSSSFREKSRKTFKSLEEGEPSCDLTQISHMCLSQKKLFRVYTSSTLEHQPGRISIRRIFSVKIRNSICIKCDSRVNWRSGLILEPEHQFDGVVPAVGVARVRVARERGRVARGRCHVKNRLWKGKSKKKD